MPSEPKEEEDVELHEIEAYYDNAQVPGQPVPTLACSCGFAATHLDWETCGAEMDAHLEEVRT